MLSESPFSSVKFIGDNENSGWVYLMYWVLALVLLLSFVFYSGRLLGFKISLLLRLLIWKRYKVFVNIDSLRFSPLGGRIFAKHVTIITENQTISMMMVTLTWRYWMLSPSRVSEFKIDATNGESVKISKRDNEKLPTRFDLLIEGLEVFMYNRTMAYENIENILNNEKKERPGEHDEKKSCKSEGLRKRNSNKKSWTSENSSYTGSSGEAEAKSENINESQTEHPSRILLSFFPIGVRVKKGAIILGNVTTPTILVASYKTGVTIVDINKAPNESDAYRQLFNMDYEAFQISMKQNLAYDGEKYLGVASVKLNDSLNKTRIRNYRYFRRFYRLTNPFSTLFKVANKKAPTKKISDSIDEWKGLKRYVGETDKDQRVMDAISIDEEYAKYSLILDTTSTKIIYYYDVPGKEVSDRNSETVNSDPEYGIHMELSNATIHYGPWADKQRVLIQNAFFPSISRDTDVTQYQTSFIRRYAGFLITIYVRDELIFRVPTRETSKDKEDIKSQVNSGNASKRTRRPFGWLELKMTDSSSISSFFSFVPDSKSGWKNTLRTEFLNPELRTSVNHDILYLAKNHSMDCDIGYPLKWDDSCRWVFNVKSQEAEFFFLREHNLLISDLFSDLASGKPVPYENIRKFDYSFFWEMEGYKIFLNVNDSNIINNPLDFNANKFLSFQGDHLDLNIFTSINGHLSKTSTIEYTVFTPEFELILDTPPWHTTNAFMTKSRSMGKASNFRTDGKYNIFRNIEINTSDHTILSCSCDFFTLKFYGFLVKYIFIIRENYIGDNKHFKTYEEYKEGIEKDEAKSDDYTYSDDSELDNNTIDSNFRLRKIAKTINDVDITLTFQVNQALLILPYNLYDCTSHIGLVFDSFELDSRFTNYYSNLEADFSEIRGVFVRNQPEKSSSLIYDIPKYIESYLSYEPEISIDGFTVHAHRMFGIPPQEITYYCKWDFMFGDIRTDGDGSILKAWSQVGSIFGFGFRDVENALSYKLPMLYDAGNFSLRCPSVSLITRLKNSVAQLDMKNILINFNDLSNDMYSIKFDFSLPTIELKLFEMDAGIRKLVGKIRTSLFFSALGDKPNSAEYRVLQQAHLRANDAPFHRIPFLISKKGKDQEYYDSYGCILTSLSLPIASIPLNEPFPRSSEFDETFRRRERSKYTSLTADTVNTNERVTIKPSLKYNPSFKVDSFIFDVNDTEVTFAPSCLSILSEFYDSMNIFTMDSTMDQIQVEVVKDIRNRILTFPKINNIRFFANQVTLRYITSANGDNVIDFQDEFFEGDAVICVLEGLSLVTSKVLDVRKNEILDFTMAFQLSNLSCTVSSSRDSGTPLKLNFSEFELWSRTNELKERVGSVNIEDISLELEESKILWICSHLEILKNDFSKFIDDLNQTKRSRDLASATLIHLISKGGIEYSIDYDPAVITRPDYVLRANKDQVRFWDKWKVITRLRHILDNLPQSWHFQNGLVFERKEFDIVENPMDSVIELFSNWRNWESNTDDRLEFFKSIFDFDHSKKNVSAEINNFQAKFINVNVHIIEDSGNYDWINASNVESAIRFQLNQPDNDLLQDEVYSLKDYFDITFNCSSLKWNSPYRLIKKLVQINATRTTRDTDIDRNNQNFESEKKSTEISFIFNFEYLGIATCLDETSIIYSATKVTNSLVTVLCPMLNTNVLSFSNRVVHQNLRISYHKTILLDFDISDTSMVLAISDIEWKPKVLDIEVGKSVLAVFPASELEKSEYAKIVQDFLQIRNLTSKNSPRNGTQPKISKDRMLELVDDLRVNFIVHESHTSVGILNPTELIMIFFHSSISFTVNEGVVKLSTIFDKSNMLVRIRNQTCLEMSNSNFSLNMMFVETGSKIAVRLNTSDEYTKFWIPNIKLTLEEYYRVSPGCLSKIDDLKSIYEEMNKHCEPRNKAVKECMLDMEIDYNYLGLSASYDKTKLSYAVEDVHIQCSNIMKGDVGENRKLLKVPMYGMFDINSTNISMSDRFVPLELSNILSFNVSIKLANELSESSHSLQIESQYFNFCCSPAVLIKLINIFDEIMDRVKLNKKSIGSSPKTQNKLSNLARSMSIHVLSYNFSLGWLFGNKKSGFSGIMIGSERFFATIEKEIGKLTLADAYLSVASNISSSTFSNFAQRKNLNRALLPKLQLLYTVENDGDAKKMKIVMNGDELDVKFSSTSSSVIESLVKSSNDVQNYFTERTKLRTTQEFKTRSDQSEYIERISSFFSSIELMATFAGSNVLLYQLDGGNEEPSSLYLQSPAVKMATVYQHNKAGARKHSLKTEIMTSSSNNTLKSTCVPVIMDLLRETKSLIRKSGNRVSNKSPSAQYSRETNLGNLLKNIDIHVGIRIDEQKICLSCDPKAKVEAIVGIKGIDIQINTDDIDSRPIMASVFFEGVSAILQHIYSREISGSFSLKSITFSSFIELSELTRVVSAAQIMDIDSYINIKQYQDIDLFKDIWFPSEKLNDKRPYGANVKSRKSFDTSKSISLRFKEVSSTYAIPWIFTLMFYNVKMRMDFGQSLGNFLLSVSKMWAISKKSPDWSQDLKLGVTDISLTSEGRLGGLVSMKNIHVHFGISWKMDNKTYDVPLIILSFRFETMQIKLLFDYHVFAIANLEGYSVDIFNRKSETSSLKDRLIATLKLNSTEVYLTSLSVSTFMDIYISISRMIQENRRSYKETLFESNNGKNKEEAKTDESVDNTIKILETVKKLETHIDMYMGNLFIQIYPASFDDTKVVILKLSESKTSFQQNEYADGISNEVEMQFNNLKVSLSATSSVVEDFVQECNIDEFTSNAHKAYGGTIFVFPSFKIYMKSFQKYKTKIIEYLYHSSFGGTVDVRWNLGSINFIREMYSVHNRALTSRIEYMQKSEYAIDAIISDEKHTTNGSNSSTEFKAYLKTTNELDQTINETLDKMSNASKFIYQPLSPPVIEAPQLKELGNATPPLEWFGLHREKFPHLTHSLGIVSLQKLNHEIEVQYSRILGRA